MSPLKAHRHHHHPLLLCVRHGETDGNAKRLLQPPTMPLSARGREQAALLGASLRDALTSSEAREGYPRRVKKILVSDLARTQETARLIAEGLGLTASEVQHVLTLTPLLQERNFGDYRGLTFREVIERVGVSTLFDERFEPPGGESWNKFHERVDRAWELIEGEAATLANDEVLIVVSHGLVLHSLIKRKLAHQPQLTPEEIKELQEEEEILFAKAPYLRPDSMPIPLENTSVTAVRVPTAAAAAGPGASRAEHTVLVLNDFSHLPESLQNKHHVKYRKFVSSKVEAFEARRHGATSKL